MARGSERGRVNLLLFRETLLLCELRLLSLTLGLLSLSRRDLRGGVAAALLLALVVGRTNAPLAQS